MADQTKLYYDLGYNPENLADGFEAAQLCRQLQGVGLAVTVTPDGNGHGIELREVRAIEIRKENGKVEPRVEKKPIATGSEGVGKYVERFLPQIPTRAGER